VLEALEAHLVQQVERTLASLGGRYGADLGAELGILQRRAPGAERIAGESRLPLSGGLPPTK
jgi:hypothetical protein